MVADRLEASGHRFDVIYSTAPGELTGIACECCHKVCRTLVVCGGDGAIHETVNGIVQADADPVFSFIPTGTGNDFKKVTHLPDGWQAATDYLIDRLAREQPPRRIDLGRCNDQIFVNGCGMGFDAQVNQIASGFTKLHGNAVYGIALIKRLLLGIDNTRMRIRVDDEVFESNVALIAANNGSHTGGMFFIAPQASVQDGLLEVIIANDLTRMSVLRLAPHVIRGTHLGRRHVRSLRCRKLSIETDKPVPAQIDGEMMKGEQTTLNIEVLPGRLRLLG